jgi:hypothetical protein
LRHARVSLAVHARSRRFAQVVSLCDLPGQAYTRMAQEVIVRGPLAILAGVWIGPVGPGTHQHTTQGISVRGYGHLPEWDTLKVGHDRVPGFMKRGCPQDSSYSFCIHHGVNVNKHISA